MALKNVCEEMFWNQTDSEKKVVNKKFALLKRFIIPVFDHRTRKNYGINNKTEDP